MQTVMKRKLWGSDVAAHGLTFILCVCFVLFQPTGNIGGDSAWVLTRGTNTAEKLLMPSPLASHRNTQNPAADVL